MQSWANIISCVLVVVWCLVTSQCVVCPAMQASQTSPHDCCKPLTPDHCGRHDTQKPCPGHDSAFETSGKIDLPRLSAAAHSAIQASVPAPVLLVLVPDAAPSAPGLQHPPPERILLNSVLLI